MTPEVQGASKKLNSAAIFHPLLTKLYQVADKN
jgi:hypothetical protein